MTVVEVAVMLAADVERCGLDRGVGWWRGGGVGSGEGEWLEVLAGSMWIGVGGGRPFVVCVVVDVADGDVAGGGVGEGAGGPGVAAPSGFGGGVGGGSVSYSAARAISRLDRPDPEVDEALIELARVGTVRDVEAAVRHFRLCAEQDRPPDVRWWERRGVRTRRVGTARGRRRSSSTGWNWRSSRWR